MLRELLPKMAAAGLMLLLGAGIGFEFGQREGQSQGRYAAEREAARDSAALSPPLLEELPATRTHITAEHGRFVAEQGTLADWRALKPEAQLAVCRAWAVKLHPSLDEEWRLERARFYYRQIESERHLSQDTWRVEERNVLIDRDLLDPAAPLVTYIRKVDDAYSAAAALVQPAAND